MGGAKRGMRHRGRAERKDMARLRQSPAIGLVRYKPRLAAALMSTRALCDFIKTCHALTPRPSPTAPRG